MIVTGRHEELLHHSRDYTLFQKDLNRRFVVSSPHPLWNGPGCNPQQAKPVHSDCFIHFHHPKTTCFCFSGGINSNPWLQLISDQCKPSSDWKFLLLNLSWSQLLRTPASLCSHGYIHALSSAVKWICFFPLVHHAALGKTFHYVYINASFSKPWRNVTNFPHFAFMRVWKVLVALNFAVHGEAIRQM